MKVTFDSNTWRKVASPDNFPKEIAIADFRTIRNAINKGSVVPFISETIFTLEAIRKKERKTFFRNYKPDIKTSISQKENGVLNISFQIGPNADSHPGNNEFLREHLADAVKLGFNIIDLPRVAGITNKEISGFRYKMANDELHKFLSLISEVSNRINELQAGDYEIQKIGLKYDANGWFIGVGKAPDSENDSIAKAVAEWADGDSVASHIAIGGDYFCTNDRAISGGAKSVFSETNLKILEAEYGFKTINPTDLAKLLTAIKG